MAFAAAMKNYFGLLPGQTIGQFAAELKALSAEEKGQFYEMLVGQGVECDAPTGYTPKA